MVLFYGGNVRNNTAAGIKKAPQFIPAKKDTRTKERVRERKKEILYFFFPSLSFGACYNPLNVARQPNGRNKFPSQFTFVQTSYAAPYKISPLYGSAYQYQGQRITTTSSFHSRWLYSITLCAIQFTRMNLQEREREREKRNNQI